MIAIRVRGLTHLHYMVQSGAVLALFWIWMWLQPWLLGRPGFEWDRYAVYSFAVVVAFLVDLSQTRLARLDLLRLDLLRNNALSLRQTVMVTAILLIILAATKDHTTPRLFLFSLVPLLYVLLFVTNRYLPGVLARFMFRGKRKVFTILLGTRAHARRLGPWLERKAIYGFRTVGLISDAVEPPADDFPLLGGPADILRVLKERQANQIILLDLPMSPQQIEELGKVCDKLGVRLLIVNDLEDKLHRPITFMEDEGFHFIGFRQEPLECPFGWVTKRILDIAISLPVVVFVLPVTNLLVACLHWGQSPGPLFFRQERSGLSNKVFSIMKYRTMHIGPHDEARQATAGDPRIFPAGKWLRKLSIDELPQFLNVLAGTMSIVGPRPHLISHDEQFGEMASVYRVRSLIKPGITGLAQVRGFRGETKEAKDMIDRVHSDLYYLENWSILLDAIIIFKTAFQVILPPKTAQ